MMRFSTIMALVMLTYGVFAGSVTAQDAPDEIIPTQERAKDGRPLLPERPSDFNPMLGAPVLPTEETMKSEQQQMHESPVMQAVTIAQLTGYMGEIAHLMRAVVVLAFVGLLLLAGMVIYLRRLAKAEGMCKREQKD